MPLYFPKSREVMYSCWMLSTVHVVWRHLLVGAREGRRRWSSVSALAGELGAAVSTTHRSLAHPVEIGAVGVTPMEGLVVLDPYRLLLLLAAHRHLHRDVVRRVRVAAPVAEVEAVATDDGTVLGGFTAVVAHAGANRIADYQTVLVYGDPSLGQFPAAPTGQGTEILVVDADPWLGRYGQVTPFAQAFADLFCLPGWQAARFVDQLDAREVAARDEPVLLI